MMAAYRSGFPPWELDEDEFDLAADDPDSIRDDLDDMGDADLERWLGDRA
jgi:hypothetical protein